MEEIRWNDMEEEIHELVIADESGDRKLTWRMTKQRVLNWIHKHPEHHDEIKDIVSEPEDIKQVRLAFEAKQAQGYDAYALNKPGDITSGKKITEFDPSYKFIVQMPRLSPGK